MARTVYEPASNEVIDLTRKVIKAFPEKFLHINMDDIHFIFKDAEKSRNRAYVKLIKGDQQTYTKKKITFCVWKQDWDSSNDKQRAFVIYHELTHLGFDEDKNKYIMRDHDVKDFHENLKLFGLNGENVDSIFTKVVPDELHDSQATPAN